MSRCIHPGETLRYVQDRDADGQPVPTPWVGREICGACGAQRLIAGDHSGRWFAAGFEPTWAGTAVGQADDSTAGMQ